MVARISEAESAILEVLWRRSPLTADEVAAVVAQERSWTPATVRTFLNRLLRKNAISAERVGKHYLYRPLLEQADHVDTESQGFLDRFFGGRVAPLVSHFSQRQKLGPEDIAELKRLIAELENGQ